MDPLAEHLVRGAHRSDLLRAAGLSRRDIDGPLWAAPYRGVRAWSPHGGDVVAEAAISRIRLTLPLLPKGGVIGGWAAAHLLGVSVLEGMSPGGQTLAVDHVVPVSTRLRKRPGIRLRRNDLDSTDRASADGVEITGRVRTAFDLSRWAPDVVEATVALDAMARRFRGLLAQLSGYVWARTRVQGIPRARTALLLARPGVDSPWETRMRLLWVIEAGLPQPRVNPAVFDRAGNLLGYPDVLAEEAGLAVEYDGAHHRDLGQHTADNHREERFERVGLRVIRLSVLDLRNRPACVRRFRAEHARGLRRDRARDGWTLQAPAWWHG